MRKYKYLLAVTFLFALAAGVLAQDKRPAEKILELPKLTKKIVREKFHPLVRISCRDDSQLYVINYGQPAELKRRKAVLAGSINFRDGCSHGPRIIFIDSLSRKNAPLTIIWRVFPDGEVPPI